jgi:hypothetical protein
MFTPDKLLAIGKFAAEGGRKVAPEIASVAENAIKKMSIPFADGVHPQQELIDALRKQGTKHINAYSQRTMNPLGHDVAFNDTKDLIDSLHPLISGYPSSMLKNPFKGMSEIPHTLANLIEQNPKINLDLLSNILVNDSNFVKNGTIKVPAISKTLNKLSVLPEQDVNYINNFMTLGKKYSNVDVNIPLDIVNKRNKITDITQRDIFDTLIDDTVNSKSNVSMKDIEDAYTAAENLMRLP